MFGNILVCPVTDPGVTSRRVYLPKGETWIDYWTGKNYQGGEWIVADAPLNRLPLFVRGGSLIPTTEVAEYTAAQIGKPITVNVYPGKDTSFQIYEDEGDGYGYEQGEYATIELCWDDSSRTLQIGKCEGEYKDMPSKRTFIVHTPWGDKTLEYTGKKIKVKM
jgi:alpha-D-xyloside xylohydrolase